MGKDSRFDGLLRDAQERRLSRRDVLKKAVAFGLSAPAVAALLAACGSSSSSSSGGSSSSASSAAATSTQASGASTTATTSATTAASAAASSSPTTAASTATTQTTGKRGDSGELRLLWWQAPTVLNPAFSNGTKDYDASRMPLEPLLDYDKDNNLVAVLSDGVPSLDNGMVEKDGTGVTIKLRQGVTWHDGQPFTANDVVFTWKYNANKDIASGWYENFAQVKECVAVDDHTVKYTFNNPYAAWFKVGLPYTLPEHVLKGDLQNPGNAKSNPYNLKPIGTGPYKVTDFKPGDVGTFEMYDKYWDPGKPHFTKVIMKGGGDAASAARAVLQTNEEDWAWNLQVDPKVLQSMESGGKGSIVTAPGGGCERMEINHSDPLKETEGQKSYYKNPHPHFKELKVRQALNYLLDRKTIANTLYGAGGDPTGSPYNTNKANMPDGIQDYEYSVDKANQLLDQVGAKKGGDGIRTLNGRKMVWVYTTSVNDVRQKTQEIVKDSCKQAGIDMTLKSTDASVFFGATDNPGSLSVFLADLEMYTNTGSFYPDLWLKRYYSEDPATNVCQKSNSWNGSNVLRYQNPQWNTLYDQTVKEIEPAKYQAGFQQLLKMAVMDDIAECGIVNRKSVSAAASFLDGYQNRGPFSSSEIWDIKSWFKKS